MPVTLKPVLLDHQWKADGTCLYRIRVTHQRKMRYIKTNVIVAKSDLARDGSVKTQSVKDNIEDLMRKLRPVVNCIDHFELEAMSIDSVVAKIESELEKEEEFVLDFVEYGRKVALRKTEGGARDGYNVALNALVRFFGRHPDIKEITVRNLRAFEQFLKTERAVRKDWRKDRIIYTKKTKSTRAVSLYMSYVRHIYKTARLEFNDPDLGIYRIPIDPFEFYSVPKAPAAKHRNVSVQLIQEMIDRRRSLTGSVRMAVDAFLISFGLCGMNAVDIYNCSKSRKGIIHYYRQKTTKRRDDKAEMFVNVCPCIKQIMDEYKDDERCFNFHKRYSDIRSFNQALSRALRIYARNNNIDSLSFYSARHSWATIGRSKLCNIDKDVISKGMCHVDTKNRTDDIYINFDWELLWEANQKIMDIFNWE